MIFTDTIGSPSLIAARIVSNASADASAANSVQNAPAKVLRSEDIPQRSGSDRLGRQHSQRTHVSIVSRSDAHMN